MKLLLEGDLVFCVHNGIKLSQSAIFFSFKNKNVFTLLIERSINKVLLAKEERKERKERKKERKKEQRKKQITKKERKKVAAAES